MDAVKLCGMIVIDLQKDFNTVDNSLLFKNLSAMGLDPLALKWFVSYLSAEDWDSGASIQETTCYMWSPTRKCLVPLVIFNLY